MPGVSSADIVCSIITWCSGSFNRSGIPGKKTGLSLGYMISASSQMSGPANAEFSLERNTSSPPAASSVKRAWKKVDRDSLDNISYLQIATGDPDSFTRKGVSC